MKLRNWSYPTLSWKQLFVYAYQARSAAASPLLILASPLSMTGEQVKTISDQSLSDKKGIIMKTSNISIISLAIILMSVSCTREASVSMGKSSGTNIGISAEIYSPATKSAASSTDVSFLESGDYSMTVTQTVEPIENEMMTKADNAVEMTRDGLKGTGFWVKGFLGDEIADSHYPVTDLNFIKGEHATYHANGSYTDGQSGETVSFTDRWTFDKDQKWRSEINHYFWGYYPDLGDSFKASKDEASISNYVTDFKTDVLVAYTQKYWDCGKHPDDGITFPFNHALSAVDVDYDITCVEQTNKEGTETKPSDRIEIQSAVMNVASKGSCTIDKNGNIVWNSVGTTKTTDVPNNVSFVIPQTMEETNANVTFQVYDKKRQISKPVQFEFPTTLKNGSVTHTNVNEWLAGNKYSYLFKGQFVAPYIDPKEPDGYNPGFAKKYFEVAAPIGTLNFDYIKTIRISWKNMPESTTGLSIYVGIVGGEIPVTIVQEDGFDIPKVTASSMNAVTDPVWVANFPEEKEVYDKNTFPNIVFAYEGGNGKNKNFTIHHSGQELYVDGNLVDYTGVVKYENTTDWPSYSKSNVLIDHIDVEKMTGDRYIYIAYRGSDNGSCQWIMENLTVEILEYM